MTIQRANNRHERELRPLRVTPNIQKDADGSLLFEMGETKIICAATVKDEVPEFLENSQSGWITAEYSLLPCATNTRASRERNKLSGRTQEIQRLIGRSLRAVTDLKLLERRTIIVDCDVLQADGGTRCASITAGFLALSFALRKFMKRQLLEDMPVKKQVAAVSIALKDGVILLDPDFSEDSQAAVDCNIVMDTEYRLIELQATAEKNSFSRDQLSAILDVSQEGLKHIFEFQSAFLSS